MSLEKGAVVEFTYTDAEGERRSWTGTVRSEDTEKGYFRLTTDEGFRTFRHDRVEGPIKPVPPG